MNAINPADRGAPHHLVGRDYLLLIFVALLLYGPAVWSGRPLSVHEGRLPQLAREMVWDGGSWLLPTSGGRPWLERPPLPHWITAGSMMLLGRVGSLWSARLPAAIAGGAIGVMAAWMVARWFGRSVGLLAGVVALSSYELYQYATLAEDDIYLGLVAVAAMMMFAWQQSTDSDGYRSSQIVADRPNLFLDFVGRRSIATLLFFVMLGITNLAKGPLVGAAPVIGAATIYAIWNRDTRTLRNYTWLWGWLIFITLTLAWPLWAMKHYPDVINNWGFDYLGKSTDLDPDAAHAWDHPFWYYPTMMPLALAPWSWATVIGLFTSARQALRVKYSPQRFIWCWAIVGLVVLSLPMRKHHQYLVPIIAPWAMLSTLGLVRVGQWLANWRPELPLLRRLVIGVVALFVVVGGWIQIAVAGRDPHTMDELKLLDYARYHVPPGEPVLINADVDSLEFFRLQYVMRHDKRLIQNLSYLRDPALEGPEMYVLTRGRDEAFLKTLGTVERLAEAKAAGRNTSPGHSFVLFKVKPTPGLQRFPATPYIGVMEAMGRKHGPWLGDGIVPHPDSNP